MLVMPILNTNKNGISKIYQVQVKLKKGEKVKKGVSIRGLDESDIIINGTSFNKSIYNTKGIEPNVVVNFLRNFNYKANKNEFLITTREYADSNLYDLYSIPIPPRKITAGLDSLYGSMILDMKKEIPGIKRGRYLSLKKIGVDKHITNEKLEKLKYLADQEKNPDKRKDLFQLNGVSDLAKTVEFMRLFDCTIISEATLTEEELSNVVNALSVTSTKDARSLAKLYTMAIDNKEVYQKLTTINKIINNQPLNLIKSSPKSKVLVKMSDEVKSA